MNKLKSSKASRTHRIIKVLGINAVVFLMLVSITGCVSFAGIPNSGSSNISISNKSDEAIKAYDLVIELTPQDSDRWATKGNALYKLNKFDEALNAYDKSIEINPHNSKVWYNKGAVLDNLNKYDEAIKAYEKAIEINPQDSKAWYTKA